MKGREKPGKRYSHGKTHDDVDVDYVDNDDSGKG